MGQTPALLCLIASASALVLPNPNSKAENDLTCKICVDLVTDIDEFLTSEQQIVEFVEEICHALGLISADLEATCIALVDSQLPAIIDGLVNDNLNPQEVCTAITACP